MRHYLARLLAIAGCGFDRTGHLEKGLSVMGGLVGLCGVVLVGRESGIFDGSPALVASMGATAVLVFAVPHGPLSQPWPVLAGHLVSALIGVGCAKLIPGPGLASACAVALAIGAMHYLRCIHPPGGATALNAVIGEPAVQDLGFLYLLTPVLLNAATIVAIAWMFNYPFSWRRYPTAWVPRRPQEPVLAPAVPVTGPELSPLAAAEIRPGATYSNGRYDADWQVRQVISVDRPESSDHAATLVNYRVVAGLGRRATGSESLAAFGRWAQCEVFRNENSWQRTLFQRSTRSGDGVASSGAQT